MQLAEEQFSDDERERIDHLAAATYKLTKARDRP